MLGEFGVRVCVFAEQGQGVFRVGARPLCVEVL